MENKQQTKSAADTSQNLVCMELPAGQGPEHELLFAQPRARLQAYYCGPLEGKLTI